MRPLAQRYLREYQTPLMRRALGKVKRGVLSLGRRLGCPGLNSLRTLPVPKS